MVKHLQAELATRFDFKHLGSAWNLAICVGQLQTYKHTQILIYCFGGTGKLEFLCPIINNQV